MVESGLVSDELLVSSPESYGAFLLGSSYRTSFFRKFQSRYRGAEWVVYYFLQTFILRMDCRNRLSARNACSLFRYRSIVAISVAFPIYTEARNH